MKKFKFLLLCTLLATAFVACDDESEKVDQPVLPTIKVEAGDAGEGTLTFTVTSADAETVKYVVIEAGSREVTADLILANGSTATANEAYEATAEGLMYETTYEIWAAARNADGVALSEKVEMTTLPKGDEPGPEPGDEYTDVLFEAEEAAAYIVDGVHQVDFFTNDYTVAVAWRGEDKIVEISDEDSSLLLDYMGVYDRTVGSQDVKFVSIVSGYFYTEDEGDGNYWAEGEFITSDNRRFLLSYWGPVEGWSEGDEPVEAEQINISSEGMQWDIMRDGLGFNVTGINAEGNGFAFTIHTGEEELEYLSTGMYPAVDGQEGCDALLADWGMEAGEWKQWMNAAGAVIVYEEEYYDLTYNEDLEYFLNIETAMPDEDLTMFAFSLLSDDKTKVFNFNYMGAMYGGGAGGDDTNIERVDYDVAYDQITEFTAADGYTTVVFRGMYDMHLCFNTNGNELATTSGWTEYDVATQMNLEKSIYMEFGLDEIVWHLQSGTIAVKATETGYIFLFYDVKTGKGDVVNYGLNLKTHSQGFEAKLPQVEPDITTISSAYTPGNYVIDRAQVVAMRAGTSFNVMLADGTGAIPATLYPLDDVKIGDYVSIDGNSVANGSFPAQFTSYSIVTKIEGGEYTYPEPYDLTNELAAFAANPSYRYVSVTGTVVAEERYGVNTYYFEVENGQGVRIKFEYPTDEHKTALSENIGKETTILGYIHGGNSEQLLMMLTQVGAEQGGSAEPTVEVEFNPTMGYSQPCGEYNEDFYFTLADANGNIMGLYIEMQGIYDMYYMNPANGEILPYCPSSNFVAAASADEEMVNEVMPGHFLDITQSYIVYGGKEYKIASASPDWTSGILNYQCMYDGATPEYDINIISGTLKAEDGSTFTLYYTGPLYTNGGGIGGL